MRKQSLITQHKNLFNNQQKQTDQETYSHYVCEFYKSFLDNTDYDDLISNACKDLYYFKNEWIPLKKNHEIMQEVEDILLLKSKKFKALHNDDYFNDENDNQDDQDDEDKYSQASEHSGDSALKKEEKDAVDLLEDWLSSDEVAQISKIKRETEGRLSIDFFKIDSNLEIVLSFLINPTLYTCSRIVHYKLWFGVSFLIFILQQKWNQRFKKQIQKNHYQSHATTFRSEFYNKTSEADINNERNQRKKQENQERITEEFQTDENKDVNSQTSLKKIQEFLELDENALANLQNLDIMGERSDHRQHKLAVYYLRSFKTAIMLTDPKNFRPIIRINNQFIDIFFYYLYDCFKRDTPCMNLNHILLNIEYFLGKEPETVFFYLIEFNLLFKLLQMMEQSQISNFLLNIILMQGQFFFMQKEMNDKLWFYLSETQFFFEMCSIMLYNKLGEYFQQKATQAYKLPSLRKLVQKIPLKKALDRNDPLSRDYMFTNFTQLPEQTFSLECDIDGIQVHLGRRKSQSTIKSQQTANLMSKIKMLKNLGVVNNLTSDLPIEQNKAVEKSESNLNQSSQLIGSHTLIEIVRDKDDESKTEEDSEYMKKSSLVSPLFQQNNQTFFKNGSSDDQKKKTMTHFNKTKNKSISQLTFDAQSPNQKLANNKQIASFVKNQNPYSLPITSLTPQHISSHDKSINRRMTSFQQGFQMNAAPLHLGEFNKKAPSNPLKLPNFVVYSPSASFMSSGQNFFKDQAKSLQNQIGNAKRIDQIQKTNAKLFKISDLCKNILNFLKYQKNTFLLAFNNDVLQVEDKRNFLYPISIQNVIIEFYIQKQIYVLKQSKKVEQTPLDVLAKNKSFNIENLIQNEDFSYNCMNCILHMFEDIFNQLENPHLYQMLKLHVFEDPIKNLKSLLGDKLNNFDMILKHFLFKQKLYSVMDANSACLAGQLVNRIIQAHIDHEQLKQFLNQLIDVLNENWSLLIKEIILNFTLSREKNQLNIRIQQIQIDKKMSTITYHLIKTLILTINAQQDIENKKRLISKISVSCLHAIILMFFEYPTNNLYQILFIQLMDQLLKYGSIQTYYIILFQLNILNYMNIVVENICYNGVLNKKLQIDGIYISIKKFMNLIDENFKERQQELTHINQQVKSLEIWHSLKSQFGMNEKKQSSSELVSNSKLKPQSSLNKKVSSIFQSFADVNINSTNNIKAQKSSLKINLTLPSKVSQNQLNNISKNISQANSPGLQSNNSLFTSNSHANNQTDRTINQQNIHQNTNQNKDENKREYRHIKSNSFHPTNQDLANILKSNTESQSTSVRQQPNFKIRTNSQNQIKKYN